MGVLLLNAPQTWASSSDTLSLELGLVCCRACLTVSVWALGLLAPCAQGGPCLCSVDSLSRFHWCLLLVSQCICLGWASACLVFCFRCLVLRFWASLFPCHLSCLIDSRESWTCSLSVLFVSMGVMLFSAFCTWSRIQTLDLMFSIHFFLWSSGTILVLFSFPLCFIKCHFYILHI